MSFLRYHHLVFLVFERQISQDLRLTGMDPSAKIRNVFLDALHVGWGEVLRLSTLPAESFLPAPRFFRTLEQSFSTFLNVVTL